MSVAPSKANNRIHGPLGLAGIAVILLVTFLVALPKGGFRAGGIPITFGYLLMAFFALFAGTAFVRRPRLPMQVLQTWFLTLFFQTVVLSAFISMGFDPYSRAMGIATLVTFIGLPNIALLLFSGPARRMPREFFFRALSYAVRFAVIFGLFLFLYKRLTGVSIEIPLLTTNIDDVNVLESRMNMRGELFKLISTYNNGNIFGVCMCMMLPLYYVIEKKRAFFYLACLAVFLTLSRTAWIGLVLDLTLIGVLEGLQIRRIGVIAAAGMTAVIGLPIVLAAMGQDFSFLLPDNLGNRATQFDVFSEFNFFPTQALSAIHEVVYASIYGIYGALGLFAFVLFITAPVIAVAGRWRLTGKASRAATMGIFVYCIIAMSDGAILFIPVMAIYFLLALVALTGPDVQRRGPAAAATTGAPLAVSAA